MLSCNSMNGITHRLSLLSLRSGLVVQLNQVNVRGKHRFYKVTYPWMNKRKPYWVHEKAQPYQDEYLTPENREFVSEDRTQTMRKLFENPDSPLLESPWPRNTRFDPRKTQRCGLIGINLGVYPMWDSKGRRRECTVVQIPDNHVIRWYPPEETDKVVSLRDMRPYMPQREWFPSWITQRRWGVQLVGAVSADPAEFSAAWCGLFHDAGVPVKRKISRFLVSSDAALQPGTQLNIEHFRVGDYVDVCARTVNRGFQGVMERWKMEGGPAAHGSTKFHRKMGSAAGGGKKIIRNKHMPGVMGNRYRTKRSVQIVRINNKHKLLYIRGALPGSTHSYCQIFDTWMNHRRSLRTQNPPPMPTFYPEDRDSEVEVPDDVFHDSIRPYDAPSLTYEIMEDTKGRR